MQLFDAGQVKNSLFSVIDSLLENRDDTLTNPQSDFTRTRKISFTQAVLFPMVAGSDNVATELLDLFGEKKLPMPSAMIQRRSQIRPEAFRKLFYLFTGKFAPGNLYYGYQLVACDGSRINLPYNPSDADTFICAIEGRKGINQVHLNSLYDVLNDIFLDIELQGIHQMNEKAAFCSLLKKQLSSGRKQIFIADRGYASYNIFANAIHNGQLFLIRVPESFARDMCPADTHWMERNCEDREISVHIGRRRTKDLHQLENYHFISARGHYDFINAGSDDADHLRLRVLKFPISEDSYEYIVTNLPKYGFSDRMIKELYSLRWNCETAYRHLKYAGNMVHIHSLKKNFLLQEVYGKLTMYNFSSFLGAAVERIQKKTGHYTYVLNHTQAQKICNRYLKGMIENVIDLISRFLVPVRPGRKFERKLRRQSADTLNYR